MPKKEDPKEVVPGRFDPNAPEIDPDLPETEDAEDDTEEDGDDPLEVTMSIGHVKELVDLLEARGYSDLSDAMLSAEVGDTITLHVEV